MEHEIALAVAGNQDPNRRLLLNETTGDSRNYCAIRLLRCEVLGIGMYPLVHCGSCAPCALHSNRSLRFLEVPTVGQ